MLLRLKTVSKIKVPRFCFSDLADVNETESWVKKLNERATSSEGKSAVGQLSSLVGYYNKVAEEDQIGEINWADWKDKLQTDGLVDKIKTNYETLTSQEYDSDKIMGEVASQESQEFRNLNSELFYHKTLWMVYYKHNLHYHVQVQNMPYLRDMNIHEQRDYYRERVMEDERCHETDQISKEVFQDLPIKTYILGQFDWGKAVVTFWRHPAEDYKGIKATKSIFGR